MDKKIKIVLAIISCIGIIILTFDTLNMLKDPQIRKLYAQHLKNDIEDSLIHFKDEALWVKKNNIKIFAEKKDNENFGLRKNNIEHFTKANNISSFPQLFYPLMTRQFFCDFHEKSEDFCVS